MTTEWSLDELYKGFDDPAYGKDVAELTAQIDALATLIADAGGMQEKERTEKVLAAQSGIAQLFYQLSLYVELRQSVNTEDGTVMAENAKLMKLQAKIAPLEAAAGKLLAGIRDVDALAKESGLVREHTFYLKEKQKEAKHLLSDEVEEMVASMNRDAILFAMANPVPEIMPDLAKAAGAKVVGTGRSDFPNQVNNVVAFPGIFKGALEGRAPQITEEMKLATAKAIAGLVPDEELNEDNILPEAFDPRVSQVVSEAVKALI